MYLTEVKQALPDIQIFLLEPFVLRGPETAEDFDVFAPEVALRAQACKRIAARMGLTFVSLQDKLSEFAEKTGVEYVLRDGVHPSYVGHELISRELYCALKSVL